MLNFFLQKGVLLKRISKNAKSTSRAVHSSIEELQEPTDGKAWMAVHKLQRVQHPQVPLTTRPQALCLSAMGATA